jgi:glucosylceramidase
MERRDVAVFFGTLERPNPRLFEEVYANTAAASVIRGVGVQWGGRGALPFIADKHPTLQYYMTEQECGDGKNDWRYARYTWSLMKQYMAGGCNGYQYWNMALLDGGVSRWGWSQNSLLSVDRQNRTYKWNYEFYLMKHLAGTVREGARRISTVSWTGYEDLLAFRNADGAIAVMAHNAMATPLPVRIGVNGGVIETTLPPDSFASIVLDQA